MAVFKFKLEPYKRILSHEKEEAQLEFALKVSRVREARAILDGLKNDLEEALGGRNERLAAGLYTEEYRLWAQRIEYLRDEVERFEKIVSEREVEAEAAKKRLLDLYVRERLVERLKERAFSEYQKNEARRLQNELDDLCSTDRSAHKGGGP